MKPRKEVSSQPTEASYSDQNGTGKCQPPVRTCYIIAHSRLHRPRSFCQHQESQPLPRLISSPEFSVSSVSGGLEIVARSNDILVLNGFVNTID